MSVDAQVIVIRRESPHSPDGTALIEASQAALEEVYPPEEIFTMNSDELAAPNAHFFIARLGDTPVGCIALVDMGRYGELKRLFVATAARGLGLGRTLVMHAETAARDIGLPVLRLETGPELTAAVRVYRALGYRERGPFGDYDDLPCSLFMEKPLD
jgi:putative acetyltransferase